MKPHESPRINKKINSWRFGRFVVCVDRGISYLCSVQQRLVRLGGFPGRSELSLCAHPFCWFSYRYRDDDVTEPILNVTRTQIQYARVLLVTKLKGTLPRL